MRHVGFTMMLGLFGVVLAVPVLGMAYTALIGYWRETLGLVLVLFVFLVLLQIAQPRTRGVSQPRFYSRIPTNDAAAKVKTDRAAKAFAARQHQSDLERYDDSPDRP